MEKEKKFGVLLGTMSLCLGLGLLALLLIINGWGDMKNQLSDMQGTLQSIRNDVSQMGNNLQEEVKEALRSSEDKIEDFNITYEDISQENETIQVHITFMVKESSLDQIIRVRAKGLEEDVNPVEMVAKSDNGLDYSCIIMLPYTCDYAFDIYQTTSEGLVKKLNMSEYNENYQTDIMNRTYLENAVCEQENNNIVLNLHIYNNTYGQELLEIKKVDLVLYGDTGKEVYREDITNNKSDRDSEQFTVSAEEIALEKESAREDFYYQISIPSSEIVDSTIIDNAQWYLEVTYNNGIKDRVY